VTEYGIADLRGKTDRDVIAAMLAIADSRFQNELLGQAKRAGKIEPDFVLPVAYCNNTPERIAEQLEPFRKAGLLPRFPFGTDFTPAEQRLLPALALLRACSPLALARLVAYGLATKSSSEVQDCLARMGLDRPSGAKEQIYALLLRGALGRAS
jgi:hypothetical protein